MCAGDPVWQSILTAPLDDEPETEQERAEVEAARKETWALAWTGPSSSRKQDLNYSRGKYSYKTAGS
jgi:hypothetical protein